MSCLNETCHCKAFRAQLAELGKARDEAARERDAWRDQHQDLAVKLRAATDRIEYLHREMEQSTEHLREVLRRVDEEQNGIAICSWCATPTSSDAASKAAHQRTCSQSPLVAELDAAVTMLHRAYKKLIGCKTQGTPFLMAELERMLQSRGIDPPAPAAPMPAPVVSLDDRRGLERARPVLEAVRHWRAMYSKWDAHSEHMAAQIALAAAWDAYETGDPPGGGAQVVDLEAALKRSTERATAKCGGGCVLAAGHVGSCFAPIDGES